MALASLAARRFLSTQLPSSLSIASPTSSFLLSAVNRLAPRASALALVVAKPYSADAAATDKPPAQQPYPCVVIGSGPAGHTASIYLARANLQPVMFEGWMAGGVAPGGQLTTTTELENWPGAEKGLTGPKLMDVCREQSLRCGAEIRTETISKIDLSVRPFKLWPEGKEDDPPIRAQSVVIATGATAKRLRIPGEEQYWQAGISACAVCDGAVPIFRKKPLAVIGGGDSAAEEAIFLTKYASKVYVLVRRDKLRASKTMADRLMRHPKVEILWNTIPVEAKGDGKLLKNLVTEDTVTKKRGSLDVNGLFYAVGHIPNVGFLNDADGKPQLKVDADGYIVTTPGSSLTSVEGVFAAGDVQDRKYRQAITAAGSGCMAALDCERWIEQSRLD
ncbi:thioredoxin-disulfide reductase [Geranomyces variabilis]|nr:thioredoxin-disulfide reductase [Geranomyces variabilis]